MNISQFIDDVVAGNASAAKETLNDILSAKAFESIDMEKKELARSVFGGQQESFEEITDDEEAYAEDVEYDGEQLDELSKSTLGSYVNKASGDASMRKAASSNWAHTSIKARNPRVKAAAEKYSDEDAARHEKRMTGIGQAVKRLTK
jgi:hypothetical protein